MKAITILEPWASLIAYGDKKIETRSWETRYRGKIAIHAARSSKVVDRPQLFGAIPAFLKLMSKHVEENKRNEYMRDNLDLGCVIAVADLVDCRKIIGTKDETVNLKGIGEAVIPNSKIILDGEKEIDGVSECDLGDYTPGRYAWILENIRRIEPVPARGQQRIWDFDVPAVKLAQWHSDLIIKELNDETNRV